MTDIGDLQRYTHEWAIRKEWRGPEATPRPLMVDLALWTSEISEALEQLRDHSDPQYVWFSYEAVVKGVKFKNLTGDQYFVLTGENPDPVNGKPEGFGPEAADLAIRLFETCEEYGIDLSFEIDRKMSYNEKREIRHGGKLA